MNEDKACERDLHGQCRVPNIQDASLYTIVGLAAAYTDYRSASEMLRSRDQAPAHIAEYCSHYVYLQPYMAEAWPMQEHDRGFDFHHLAVEFDSGH